MLFGEYMDYKISIIIPVFRVEKYITRCCTSLFEMSFNDVEFLFVDDATPDGSIEAMKAVLKQYSSRAAHTKVLSHKQNMGVACARNTGLEAATGKYIAFVDADDWVEADMFEKLYRLAERSVENSSWKKGVPERAVMMKNSPRRRCFIDSSFL